MVDRPSAASTTTVDERLPVVIAPLRQEVLDDGSIEISPEDGSAFSLEQVLIDASGSAPYTLYGVPVGHGQETVLAQGTLRSGQVSADVETGEPMVRVVLQVDGEAEVNDVSLVGRVRVY